MRTAIYFFLLIVHQSGKSLVATWRRAAYRAAGVRISGGVHISVDPGCNLVLAPGVSIGTGALLVSAHDPLRKELTGNLDIGAGTAVNEYCNIRASGGRISIGRDCMFGQFATVIGSNHGMHPDMPMQHQEWDTERLGVTVGDDVWIGSHTVILPGVSIGAGAVVAGGAVVNRDVPPFEIWGGVPARRLASRLDSLHAEKVGGRQ